MWLTIPHVFTYICTTCGMCANFPICVRWYKPHIYTTQCLQLTKPHTNCTNAKHTFCTTEMHVLLHLFLRTRTRKENHCRKTVPRHIVRKFIFVIGGLLGCEIGKGDRVIKNENESRKEKNASTNMKKTVSIS